MKRRLFKPIPKKIDPFTAMAILEDRVNTLSLILEQNKKLLDRMESKIKKTLAKQNRA